MSLEDVTVGERIIVDSFGRHGTYTVERLTRTQVICDCDVRFNRQTGYKIGEESMRGWGRTRARKMTAADFLNERLKNASDALRRFPVTAENIDSVELLLAARGKEQT